MKNITLKNKKDTWTLTLVGNEEVVKKAALFGLASFVERVAELPLETIRGAMGLAGMLINEKILSPEERDIAQSYYTTLNKQYRELSNHT